MNQFRHVRGNRPTATLVRRSLRSVVVGPTKRDGGNLCRQFSGRISLQLPPYSPAECLPWRVAAVSAVVRSQPNYPYPPPPSDPTAPSPVIIPPPPPNDPQTPPPPDSPPSPGDPLPPPPDIPPSSPSDPIPPPPSPPPGSPTASPVAGMRLAVQPATAVTVTCLSQLTYNEQSSRIPPSGRSLPRKVRLSTKTELLPPPPIYVTPSGQALFQMPLISPHSGESNRRTMSTTTMNSPPILPPYMPDPNPPPPGAPSAPPSPVLPPTPGEPELPPPYIPPAPSELVEPPPPAPPVPSGSYACKAAAAAPYVAIPRPPGVPLLRNMLQLLSKENIAHLDRFHGQLKDKYGGIYR
jgi:hypothetical protein